MIIKRQDVICFFMLLLIGNILSLLLSYNYLNSKSFTALNLTHASLIKGIERNSAGVRILSSPRNNALLSRTNKLFFVKNGTRKIESISKNSFSLKIQLEGSVLELEDGHPQRIYAIDEKTVLAHFAFQKIMLFLFLFNIIMLPLLFSRVQIETIRIPDAILLFVFFAALSLPVAGTFFGIAPRDIQLKDLNPVELQDIRNAPWSEFPAKFEKYFSDNLGFRNSLIYYNSYIRLALFHVSPLPQIILGKHGWAFYNSDAINDGNTINDFRGLDPISVKDLERIRQVVTKQTAWLRQRGIRYLIIIPPNKTTIYPEYMPDYLTRVRNETRLDQFTAMVREDGGIPYIDLREPLLQAKKKRIVYYRTGTHWNEYGAFIGYQAVMEAIRQTFPGTAVIGENSFAIRIEQNNGEDTLFGMVNMKDYFYSERVVMLPDEKRIPPIKKINKLVLFHDSFGPTIKRFLDYNFNTVIMQHFNDEHFDYALIVKEKPDFVLLEITERYFSSLTILEGE